MKVVADKREWPALIVSCAKEKALEVFGCFGDGIFEQLHAMKLTLNCKLMGGLLTDPMLTDITGLGFFWTS